LPGAAMYDSPIPSFCVPCIQRLQAHCPHAHTFLTGNYYLWQGEMTDDITEFCADCGANLDRLPLIDKSLPDVDETIPF
jgi:hypothetical protein